MQRYVTEYRLLRWNITRKADPQNVGDKMAKYIVEKNGEVKKELQHPCCWSPALGLFLLEMILWERGSGVHSSSLGSKVTRLLGFEM